MSAVPSTENDDAAVETPTETTPTGGATRPADDAELRAEVLELLRAHRRADGFVDSAAGHIAPLVRDAAA